MYAKASGRSKTTSVMQTLSGLSGRLSQRESDLNLPPGRSSEAGFELVHQAVCVMPHWLIQGDCEGKWSVQMQIRVTTNVHSFNVCQASHSFSQVLGVNQGV